jgi:hypothetical protein
MVGMWSYLKRVLGRDPDYPGSLVNLGLSAYALLGRHHQSVPFVRRPAGDSSGLGSPMASHHPNGIIQFLANPTS